MRSSIPSGNPVMSGRRNTPLIHIAKDNSFVSFNFHGTLLALAVNVNTSPFVVLPAVAPYYEISVTRGLQQTYKISQESVLAEFAMELQKRSRSLSQKDTELYKKLIQSKLKPGFPEF